MRTSRPAALVLAGVLLVVPAAGSVLYVDASATGARTGASWDDAFADLQDALDVATAGDEIRIADGRYVPTAGPSALEATFEIPPGVTLRGGWAGAGAPDPDARDPALFPSVLDGDAAGDDVPFDQGVNRGDNVSHVVTPAPGSLETVLDGLVVRGGRGGLGGRAGGGVFAEGVPLRLADCIVEDNRAVDRGGGLWVGPGADAVVDRCLFDRNLVDGDGTASVGGGAISCRGGSLVVTDTDLVGNVARGVAFPAGALGGAVEAGSPGGGSITARLERCRFLDNESEQAAGALVAQGDVDVVDCLFEGNRAVGGGALFQNTQGGAAQVSDGVRVTDCLFVGNISQGGQPSASRASALAVIGPCFVANSVFVGNGSVASAAEAVLVGLGEGAVVEGCTVAGNTASGTTAGLATFGPGSADVVNSILWGNAASLGAGEQAQVADGGGILTFTSCSIEGWTGTLPGTGNVAADPLFADLDGPDDLLGTADDDARLGAGSGCIDAGSSPALSADGSDVDCDGDVAEPRPLDAGGLVRRVDDPAVPDAGTGAPVVDIGAHEAGADLPTDVWDDLGGGSAGAFGQPQLTGLGTFCESQVVAIELAGAPPGSLALLLESLSSTPVPKWGGIVYAVPIFAQFLVVTDGAGGFRAEAPLIEALPPGLEVFYQFLVQDGSVSPPIILSNATRATIP